MNAIQNSKKQMPKAVMVAIAIAIWALAGCGGNTNQNSQEAHPKGSTSITQTPVAVPQQPTAKDVAAQLHGKHFVSKKVSTAAIWGMTSGGTCWIDGKKYGINTFNSKQLRDAWLKVAKQYGVSPKWMTDTAVVYPSVLSH